MQNMPSPEELEASYQALQQIVNNQKFKDLLSEIVSKRDPLERLQAAFSQLTLQTLADKGIPTPEGLSITIRASREESTDPTIRAANAAAAGQNAADWSGLQIWGTLWFGHFVHVDWKA